jgi:flagellar hook-associated protein FlgK
MQIGSVITQGLIGMQNSQAEMTRLATQIAEAGTTQRNNPQANDVVEPLINLQLQSQLFDSSARVVQVADETLGTLLDIKA